MAFVKVTSLEVLKREKLMEVMVNGNLYALCYRDGEVFALSGVCPHMGGPLGQGVIEGHTINCPWHMWQFDCRTGTVLHNPENKISTYAAKIEGGAVWVDIP